MRTQRGQVESVKGDVGAFDALISNIFQIFIFVKSFFTPCRTTACVFPIDRQSPANFGSAVPQKGVKSLIDLSLTA